MKITSMNDVFIKDQLFSSIIHMREEIDEIVGFGKSFLQGNLAVVEKIVCLSMISHIQSLFLKYVVWNVKSKIYWLILVHF